MAGATVMTTYNKKMYRVDEIDFSKKVTDSFVITKTGKETTFK